MTNKEAIEILKDEWRINAELFGAKFGEALDLAIKSLEFAEKYFPNSFNSYINGEQIM